MYEENARIWTSLPTYQSKTRQIETRAQVSDVQLHCLSGQEQAFDVNCKKSMKSPRVKNVLDLAPPGLEVKKVLHVSFSVSLNLHEVSSGYTGALTLL